MLNNKYLAQSGLLLVTIIWGVTFILVQEALNDAPPFSFAFLRFGLAFVLTLLLINSKINSINKNEFIGGLICGLFLFMGYAFQNFGLMNTSASKSAFITSVSVLMVPFFLVIFNIQSVSIRKWLAVMLATIGLYLLLLPGGGGLNLGDILTFGCAIAFAIHIIIQDFYIKKKLQLFNFFLIQSGCVTILSFVSAYFTESQSIMFSDRLIVAILITGILATFVAFIIMIWAQNILNPTETAIIFAMEPVAATLFAMFYANEVLGFWGIIGGTLIFLAVIYGEYK